MLSGASSFSSQSSQAANHRSRSLSARFGRCFPCLRVGNSQGITRPTTELSGCFSSCSGLVEITDTSISEQTEQIKGLLGKLNNGQTLVSSSGKYGHVWMIYRDEKSKYHLINIGHDGVSLFETDKLDKITEQYLQLTIHQGKFVPFKKLKNQQVHGLNWAGMQGYALSHALSYKLTCRNNCARFIAKTLLAGLPVDKYPELKHHRFRHNHCLWQLPSSTIKLAKEMDKVIPPTPRETRL